MPRKGSKSRSNRGPRGGLERQAMIANYVGAIARPPIDPPLTDLNAWYRGRVVARNSTNATAGVISSVSATDVLAQWATQTGVGGNLFKFRILSFRAWALPTLSGPIIPTLLVSPYSFYALAQDPLSDLLDFGTTVDPARVGWVFGVPSQAQVYDSTDTGVRVLDFSSTNISQSVLFHYEIQWRFV